MDEATMKHIATNAGCNSLYFKEHALASGGVSTYVIVSHKDGRGRSLGKLSDVALMDEEQLRRRIAAKFAPRPVLEAQLSLTDIENIIREQGYRPYIENRAENVEYVYAWQGNVNKVYLGRCEVVAAMSKEELGKLIAAKFAQKAAQV